MSHDIYDALIIGGGPAGAAAALWLGRYRRRVRIYDSNDPRNEPAWAVHGYPGIQDPSPIELRRRLVQQVRGEGVETVRSSVVALSGEKDAFRVRTDGGEEVTGRRVVLAYGLRDYIPDVDGIQPLYGTSVFHCADCDGPSVAGLRLGVLGRDRHAANLALYLRHFSEHVTLLTGGNDHSLSPDARDVLERNNVRVRTDTLARVSGHGGNLTQAEFAEGATLRLDAMFFHLGSEPRCNLAEQMNCHTDDDGYVQVDRGQETSCPGLHAAGDITGPPHLASIAAAEGVRAALAMHRSLLPDERHI